MDPRCENIHPRVFKNKVVDTARNKKYYLQKPWIGKGGYAYVYLATDSVTKEQFACKVLNKSLLDNKSMKEKIAKEIVLHSEMNHRNVLKFHSYFEDDFNIYMILEYCKHGSLADLMSLGKIFTEDEVRVVMKQVLDGITYIHFKCIVHRDIKPHNIFIHEDMTLKIGDFGLSTPIEYLGYRRSVICGTPKYVAPEVLNGEGYSYEVDTWSLGVTMYHLLLGCSPFDMGKCLPYELIMKGDYKKIPPGSISEEATDLIASLLVVNDRNRATVSQIINSKFMRKWKNFPSTLPLTILDPRNRSAINTSSAPVPEPQLLPRIRSPSPEPPKKIFKRGPPMKPTPAPEQQSQPEISPSPKKPKKFFKGERFMMPIRSPPLALGRILPLKPMSKVRRKPAQRRQRFAAES